MFSYIYKSTCFCFLFITISYSQIHSTPKNIITTFTDDSVNTTFWITIPHWTPQSDTVFIIGDIPELGNFTDYRNVPLERINEVTWKKEISLPTATDITYQFSRGTSSTKSSGQYRITAGDTNTILFNAVTGWVDIENHTPMKTDFIGAAALVDWSAQFAIEHWFDRNGSGEYSALDTTFNILKERAGLNLVGFPEAIFYSQLLPTPIMVREDQGEKHDLSEDENIKIINLAKANELNYYFHIGNPEINNEIAQQVGTDNPFGWVPANIADDDTLWWDEWFNQWGDYLVEKALIAEDNGVNLMTIGGHLDYIDRDINSNRWIELINRIRAVFSGQITYIALTETGPNPAWADHLDYICVTLGVIAEVEEPSLDQLKDGIRNLMSEITGSKPIIFYINNSSINGSAMGAGAPDINEPTAHLSIDYQEQADIYEAFFQVAVEDDRIAGFISWNYAYFDDFFYWPGGAYNEDMRFTSSIRNKLAEAVTFKWAYAFQTLGVDDANSIVPNMPQKFRLYQNYPNPFNPETTIQYELPNDSQVKIIMYDLMGKEIKILTNEYQPKGQNNLVWNGTDNTGHLVSGGIYFCKLQAGDFIQTQKMVFLK